MPLKVKVGSLDEVPAELRSFYVERDGAFVLDADGLGDTGERALANERQARRAAEKALGDLKRALGDADPAKAREALRALADLEDKAGLGEIPAALAPKIDELVAKRTARMAADYEGKVGGLTAQLEAVLIEGAIRSAAAKAHVRPSAIDDAVLFGRQVWKLKDGKPVAHGPDGAEAFGADGKPLTVETWVAERAKDRPHWFEASGGGGATPPGGRGTGGAVVLTRDQAKDRATYLRAREDAAKQGVEVVIQ